MLISQNIESFSFIKVSKFHVNKVIAWLNESAALNKEIKIISQSEKIYIPFLFLPSDWQELSKEFLIEILDSKCKNRIEWQRILELVKPRQVKYKKSLKEVMEPILPQELIEKIPRSFDIIGDIAIIELNRQEQQELKPYFTLIGQKLLEIHPNLKSIFQKGGDVEGIFRTRKVELIAGAGNSTTLYKENNAIFQLDIEKVFFTPRLSFERNRIANLITRYSQLGVIWDMFCGIGPFFIQIAKHQPDALFLATDANPDAIKYAEINIQKNKIKNSIELHTQNLENIGQNPIFEKFYCRISRIMMNLPEISLNYIKILPHFIHQEGALIHIYQFNEKADPIGQAVDLFAKEIKENELELNRIVYSGIVKPFSPSLDMTVIDAIIKKKDSCI